MKISRNWVWVLLFGSLWGMNELFTGELLSSRGVPHYSVILAAWAFFILAVARGVWNKPGSSTMIAAVATLFKLANTAPFICHLAGIFLLGVGFDIVASLLLKKENRITLRSVMTGILGAYAGYSLFAIIITYVIRYHIWVEGGLPKIVNHIFVGGSFAALAAAIVVPVGLLIGRQSTTLPARRPGWTYAGSILITAILWTLARFVV